MNRKAIAPLAVAAALIAPQAASALTVQSVSHDLYAGGAGTGTACSVQQPCSLATAIQQADTALDNDTIHLSGTVTTSDSVQLDQSRIDLVGSAGAQIDLEHRATLTIGRESSVVGVSVRSRRRPVKLAHGGVLRDATVEASGDAADDPVAIEVFDDGTTSPASLVTDVAVQAPAGTGVLVQPHGNDQVADLHRIDVRAARGLVANEVGDDRAEFRLFHSRISASQTGVVAGGFAQIWGTLIDAGPGASAVEVSRNVNVQLSTVVGHGGGTGVHLAPGADAYLGHVIVRGFGTDLRADDVPTGESTSAGTIKAIRSSIGTSQGATIDVTDPAPGGDPLFVDPASGDYRLSKSSPLVDAGVEIRRSELPDTARLDLAGSDRLVDGDGDGHAQIDVGAYEYQPQPDPPATGNPATPPAASNPSTPPSGDQQADTLTPEQPNNQEQSSSQGDQAADAPRMQTGQATLPRLSLSGKALRVDRDRRTTLGVSCQAGSSCRLSVTLTARIRGRNVRLARSSATSKGASTRVHLRLSPRSIALVRRYRVRSVSAAVSAEDASGAKADATRAYALRLAR